VNMNKNETPVNLLIADSQFLITESLKVILSENRRFKIIDVVSEKSELLRILECENIILLIIDHTLTDIGNISELKEIKAIYPDLKVLIISNSIGKNELHELNSAGLNNIILKTVNKEELFEAIDSTLRGKKYFSNELLDLLFDVNDRRYPSDDNSQLTVSEIEIVHLIADGLTTKEIAARKFISFHTVISHRKNIFRKLGVSSISELIMYSIKTGLINTIEYNI
jgi:DNA-binding NarL/FixJ family response regulator